MLPSTKLKYARHRSICFCAQSVAKCQALSTISNKIEVTKQAILSSRLSKIPFETGKQFLMNLKCQHAYLQKNLKKDYRSNCVQNYQCHCHGCVILILFVLFSFWLPFLLCFAALVILIWLSLDILDWRDLGLVNHLYLSWFLKLFYRRWCSSN